MTWHALIAWLIAIFTVTFVAVSGVVGAYNRHEDGHQHAPDATCLFCKRVWRE